MLYIVHGNNVGGVRARAYALIGTFPVGIGGLRELTAASFSKEELQSLAGASSLFAAPEVVLLDTLSENGDSFLSCLDCVELLAASENTFVMIEGALTVPHKKILAPHAKELIEVKKEDGAARFNTFALADALLRRDKKALWTLLVEAWAEGIPTEEIIGTLLWQIKILRLAEQTKGADEAGQKPFVYDKAKRALSKFKAGELEMLGGRLLAVYHEGHMGKRDINLALEMWVLKL